MVDHKAISVESRTQLFDDTFVLASVNQVPYAQALDLSLFLQSETDYVPWKTILSKFSYIHNMLYSSNPFEDWKVFFKIGSLNAEIYKVNMSFF